MHIVILTLGTRGDVEPFIAFGKGLLSKGYQVTIATFTRFESLVRSQGINFRIMPGDSVDLLYENQIKPDFKGFIKKQKVQTVFRSFTKAWLDSTWENCKDADAIIYHPLVVGAYHCAEALEIPIFASSIIPFTHTQQFCYPGSFGGADLGGLLNYWSYHLIQQRYWLLLGSLINTWRKEALNLPALPLYGPFHIQRKEGLPILYHFSNAVCAAPKDWPSRVHVTGYWSLESPTWNPPDQLVDFLESGLPPICCGFGSMLFEDSNALTRIIVEAAHLSSQRLLLLGGWGSLGSIDLPENVFCVDYAPHKWLLPKCSSFIHHGGGNTVGAALRAGVPSIVIPIFVDQPFWSRRLWELGASPKGIPLHKLNIQRLSNAIELVKNRKSLSEASKKLSEKINLEHGVSNALAAFETHLNYYPGIKR
jgi:sterol 3beta-glucosyltransferase